MAFHPFETATPHIVYACLGGFVVVFSMFSTVVKEKLYVGEVVLATVFGIALGPYGANIFTPRTWGNIDDAVTNDITLEVMRVVLALGVFAIGVELPKSYMWKNRRSLSLLVVPVMAWGWLVSAGLICAIFPDVTYLSGLVISACLTPTDPVLAASIVNGKFANKNVPGYLRRLIAAESAANDGLAYPFLFFSLYMTIDATPKDAIRDFFTIAILYSVVFGTVLGAFIGYAFNKIMRLMERVGSIGSESYAVQFVALAVFTIGVATLLGCDDLLAAFAAGSAVSWDGHFNEKSEDTMVFATIVEVMLNCAAFVFIGAWIRFEDFHVPSLNISPLRLFAFFASILFIRRIPLVLVVYRWIPDIRTWQQALFVGWFGPMGVGAVFISTYALTYLPEPAYPPTTQQEILVATIQPIVAFAILGSILVHGLSIPAFSMARRINTMHTLTRPLGGPPEWLNQITLREDGREHRGDHVTSHTATVETTETSAGGAPQKAAANPTDPESAFRGTSNPQGRGVVFDLPEDGQAGGDETGYRGNSGPPSPTGQRSPTGPLSRVSSRDRIADALADAARGGDGAEDRGRPSVSFVDNPPNANHNHNHNPNSRHSRRSSPVRSVRSTPDYAAPTPVSTAVPANAVVIDMPEAQPAEGAKYEHRSPLGFSGSNDPANASNEAAAVQNSPALSHPISILDSGTKKRTDDGAAAPLATNQNADEINGEAQ